METVCHPTAWSFVLLEWVAVAPTNLGKSKVLYFCVMGSQVGRSPTYGSLKP